MQFCIYLWLEVFKLALFEIRVFIMLLLWTGELGAVRNATEYVPLAHPTTAEFQWGL